MDVALAANVNVKVVSNLATLCLNNRPLQLVQVTSRGVGGVGVFFFLFVCLFFFYMYIYTSVDFLFDIFFVLL